jgi:peptide-methionine (R)-S-oxide reductase
MRSFLDRMRGAKAEDESESQAKAPPLDGKVAKSEAEWKKQLSHEEYRVLRESGTERPWTGDLCTVYPTFGVFSCKACDAPLYPASAKFDSKSGWPSFDEEIAGAVTRRRDVGAFGVRTEVVCSRCDSHLGHVFSGERMTEKSVRHCINSVCLNYEPES